MFSVCGAHIDGFPANAATTCIVGGGSLDGPQADVMLAAWTAFQAAQRVIKEAATNNEVTEAIAKACAAYECQPVEGGAAAAEGDVRARPRGRGRQREPVAPVLARGLEHVRLRLCLLLQHGGHPVLL